MRKQSDSRYNVPGSPWEGQMGEHTSRLLTGRISSNRRIARLREVKMTCVHECATAATACTYPSNYPLSVESLEDDRFHASSIDRKQRTERAPVESRHPQAPLPCIRTRMSRELSSLGPPHTGDQ